MSGEDMAHKARARKRGRERERECVRERARARERQCVCFCVRERECASERDSARVRQSEKEREREIERQKERAEAHPGRTGAVRAAIPSDLSISERSEERHGQGHLSGSCGSHTAVAVWRFGGFRTKSTTLSGHLGGPIALAFETIALNKCQ